MAEPRPSSQTTMFDGVMNEAAADFVARLERYGFSLCWPDEVRFSNEDVLRLHELIEEAEQRSSPLILTKIIAHVRSMRSR